MAREKEVVEEDEDLHTGYLLNTENIFPVKKSSEHPLNTFITYAWTFLDLFTPSLHTGLFKLPLYTSPLSLTALPLFSLTPTSSHLWFRISASQPDPLPCLPIHSNLYSIPPLHTLAQPALVKHSTSYQCLGLNIYLSYAQGHKYQRHVRLALCL
jgi:hypothetical protein